MYQPQQPKYEADAHLLALLTMKTFLMQTSVSVHRKHSEPHKKQVCLSFHFRDGKVTWHCSSLEPSLNYLMKQRKMPKIAMKSLRSLQLCNSFCPWRMFSRDSSDAIPMLIVKTLIFETRYVRLVEYSVFKCLHPTIQYQNMSISHSKHFGARTYVRGYPKQ